MFYLVPLQRLLATAQKDPVIYTYLWLGVGLAGLVALAALLSFRKYFAFIFKSLFRNVTRTVLASAVVGLSVVVLTVILSIVVFIELALTEQTKNFKAIVTERYQIPSQMPFTYAYSLERGAPRNEGDVRVQPEDSMTWQFFGGSLDPAKRTRENIVFFFAMDPSKLRSMMDEMESLDPALVEKMKEKKSGVLLGKARLEALNKQVGDRFKLTSFNYKDIDLEFEIVGMLPKGRYDQSAVMNRDYLNDALDAYPRTHNGQKHPMAGRTLNLVWVRVPDSDKFKQVADQIMTSPEFSSPSVKCETASTGISAFLDAYKDLFWGIKFLLVPSILCIMSLVIACAISISVRERRAEMAVLKVLGYTPNRIMAFVLGEAILVGGLMGFLAALAVYLPVHFIFKGIAFPIAFFPIFDIFVDALWWGLLIGVVTSFAGSIVPAWSARTIKVSEVFSKVG